MEYLDAKKTSGLLLFIDFEKAFDSLEWDFMNKALNAFNFGPNVKRWITIFYKGVQSAVMNGGFWQLILVYREEYARVVR